MEEVRIKIMNVDTLIYKGDVNEDVFVSFHVHRWVKLVQTSNQYTHTHT